MLTRTLGLFVALVFTGSAFAASSLEVKAQSKDGNVSLHYKTVRTNSSMCGLVTTRFEIARAHLNGRLEGTVVIDASVDPRRPCLTAFGPHRGAVTIARGPSLPQLPNGSYRLTINGESYGTLVVTATDAKLVE